MSNIRLTVVVLPELKHRPFCDFTLSRNNNNTFARKNEKNSFLLFPLAIFFFLFFLSILHSIFVSSSSYFLRAPFVQLFEVCDCFNEHFTSKNKISGDRVHLMEIPFFFSVELVANKSIKNITHFFYFLDNIKINSRFKEFCSTPAGMAGIGIHF